MTNKNNLLARLARHYKYREKPFQLSSGQESHEYLDCRTALSDPTTLRLAAHEIHNTLGLDIHAIGGLTMGADPLAIGVCLVAPLPTLSWFSVRKEPKKYGTGKLVEGFCTPGELVAVVEDVSTTGASARRAIEACLQAHLGVGQVVALVDRGGIAQLRKEYVGQVTAIFPFADVSMVGEARQLALTAHAHQEYGDHLPYSVHLAAVVQVVAEMVPYYPLLLAAAWLHDVLEDTSETAESLYRARIPGGVVPLVDACTDGEGENRKARKARPFELIPKTTNAIVIKLADRIANVENARRDGKDDLLGMYRKEQSKFYERLQNAPTTPDIDIKPFWDRLAVAFV